MGDIPHNSGTKVSFKELAPWGYIGQDILIGLNHKHGGHVPASLPSANTRRTILMREMYRALNEGPSLGSYYACWCGQASGHPWPGKKKGAPHPRDNASRCVTI